MRVACLFLLALVSGCSRQPEQRAAPKAAAPEKQPSPFDKNFWDHWSDGKVEVCRYQWGSGSAVMYTHVDPQRNLWMRLWKRAEGATEMLEVRLTLDGSESEAPGSVTSVVRSRQDASGPSWEQAALGVQRALVTVLRPGRPDARRVIEYPNRPFPSDSVLLWARRIAWPRIGPNVSRRVISIEGLREIGSGRLRRMEDSAQAQFNDGTSVSLQVHPALPHPIKAWSSSSGDRGTLVSCERLLPSSLHLVMDGGEFGAPKAAPAK